MEYEHASMFEAAKTHLERGEFSESVRKLLILLEFDPVNPAANELLITAREKQGKINESLKAARNYASYDESVKSRKMLGNKLKEHMFYHAAYSEYERALELSPDNPEILSKMGLLCVSTEDFEKGYELLSKQMKTSPGDSTVLFDYAKCCFYTGRTAEAYGVLKKMETSYPMQQGIRAWLGRCAEINGDAQEAECFFLEELSRFPWSADGADFYAKMLDKAGKKKEADSVYGKAFEAAMEKRDAMETMGNTLTKAGKYRLAERLFKKLLELTPESGFGKSMIYSNYGGSLMNAGRHKEAEACFEESLKIYENNRYAVYNRGIRLDKDGDYEGAVKYYKRALELEPEWDIALINMAKALKCLRRIKEADGYYRLAAARRPEKPEFRELYAVFLTECYRYEEAEAQAREALRLKPDCEYYSYLLAFILYRNFK